MLGAQDVHWNIMGAVCVDTIKSNVRAAASAPRAAGRGVTLGQHPDDFSRLFLMQQPLVQRGNSIRRAHGSFARLGMEQPWVSLSSRIAGTHPCFSLSGRDAWIPVLALGHECLDTNISPSPSLLPFAFRILHSHFLALTPPNDPIMSGG